MQLLEQLSHSNPANATLREYLGEAYQITAQLLQQKGNLDQALAYYRHANRVFAGLIANDRANSLARNNFGSTAVGMARELLLQHEIQSAITQARLAVATLESIEHKNRYDIATQAQSYSALGMAYEAMADRESSPIKKTLRLREARSWLQKSVATWQQEGTAYAKDQLEADGARQELAKCESALAKPRQ